MIGFIIFLVCTWAAFSKRVDDGFVGRHLLTFAAIAGAAYGVNGDVRAFFTAYVLLIAFALWHTFRKVWKLANVSQ